MTSEIRRLRQQLHLLLTEPETATLDDEVWYDRMWELLDPVIDARAARELDAAKRADRRALWASWTDLNPPAIFDVIGNDPDNG